MEPAPPRSVILMGGICSASASRDRFRPRVEGHHSGITHHLGHVLEVLVVSLHVSVSALLVVHVVELTLVIFIETSLIIKIKIS